MEVLGFNDPTPTDPAFCICGDDSIAHFELERFSRNKYEHANPVLGFIELCPNDLTRYSHIAVEEAEILAPAVRRLRQNGRAGIDDFVHALGTSKASKIMGTEYATPAGFRPDRKAVEEFAAHLLSRDTNIYFSGHHECHAANAHLSSGEEDSMGITLDGGGYDRPNGVLTEVHGSVWRFSQSTGRPIHYETSQSMGMAWSRCVRVLGLRWGEEGTLMAMAAFGDPAHFAKQITDSLLWNTSYTASTRPGETRAAIETLQSSLKSTQDQFDLAAALQSETELRVHRYLHRFLVGYTGALTLSGGVFLNCLATGKIAEWFPALSRVYIPPAPYDGGISIGAAQLAHRRSLPWPSAHPHFLPFGAGRHYSESRIRTAARSRGIELVRGHAEDVVRMIGQGAVVAIFQGAAESGRRALGSRSLLADPRKPEIRERLNTYIKHRKKFRPFAPMVLSEQISECFEAPPGFESPYMSFAIRARPRLREKIPAVLHVDGTARVQTVHSALTPHLHHLLTLWHAHSGVPVLLNTSFNDSEPIVETPDDAFATFERVPIEAIYFADYALMALKTPEHGSVGRN
jgi:carbamoyltransferase